MISEIFHRKTCRMCGSSNLELVYQLSPTPIGDAYVTADQLDAIQKKYPIDMFLCRECGLVQLLDIIAPEILYGNYIYTTSSSPEMQEHFPKASKEITERIRPATGTLVVDIGSNDGTLLRHFKKAGLRVVGVEPATEIARSATENGVNTIPGFFTPNLARQIRQQHGPASIITANNVLANIDDLSSFAEGIRVLLAPDGVFIFESFYIADVIENKVFDFIYHEHLSAFSVAPVQRFFQRRGMSLIDIQRIPTKGGSLRYTVQLQGGPRPISPSIESMLNFEERNGLYHPHKYRDFLAVIDGLKQLTLNHLKNLKSEGKIIAGYGASITGTTLIYHFDIGGYLDYLIDDNPAKQGRYSPGQHIPVYHPKLLYDRKPDYVIILAWRFAEQIIRQHEEFLNQGGKFIIPIPDFQIIERL